jgi:menaquinone-specific isochorismate synthase
MATGMASERIRTFGRRLASVSARVDGVRPDALLGLASEGPRGFWAREGRWFAHLGTASSVEVTAPEEARDRFRRVWDQARHLLSGSRNVPESEVQPPKPRFFGGFAFGNGHLAEGPWESFPLARFVLPEVELVGSGEGEGILTCRSFLEEGEGSNRCRERLRSRLAQVKAALELPGPDPGAEEWSPDTRVETAQEEWAEAVERALTEMEEGGVSKVVLARVQAVSAEACLDPVDVVMNLWRDNPGAHVFLFEPRPGHVLLGAAPETVATVEGGLFRATAVAGSVARGDSEAERRAHAENLLRSPKDLREHRMCVDDMVERLRAVSCRVSAEAEPRVLTLSTIQHLETAIRADLLQGQTVLSVLEALHPTPAVCGLPRDLAQGFLEREERFQRGWYAGPVGWFDGEGNGVFVPALRSAVARDTEWRLFAGAGIVAGSDPHLEWDETSIKFQPVLRALAKARGGRPNPRPVGAEGS